MRRLKIGGGKTVEMNRTEFLQWAKGKRLYYTDWYHTDPVDPRNEFFGSKTIATRHKLGYGQYGDETKGGRYFGYFLHWRVHVYVPRVSDGRTPYGTMPVISKARYYVTRRDAR